MINHSPNSGHTHVSPYNLDADRGITRNLQRFQVVHMQFGLSCALSDKPASKDITV